jgi:UDP-N-acetylmuramate--alanine ligase
MSFSEIPAADSELSVLVRQALAISGSYVPGADTRWLLVDVARQRLILLHGQATQATWPVSTAAAGLDNRQDSGGTPPGVHRIERKIGADCPPGTVFVGREPTGERWQPQQTADAAEPGVPDDLILTRILTLAGCEPGLNQGPGVDSRERYIYLHGTNHENHIGTPVSHGCVRLTNADIGEVFALVQEGDPVVIF